MREKASARILESALRVFARKGNGATVSDIAEEAGVSQGLAYRYFASKDAMFHALLRQMLQSGEAEEFYREEGKTPRERLERFITDTMRLRRERPELYRLLFQALWEERLPKDIRQRLASRGREVRRVIRELIMEGQAIGEVSKGEPDQLVDVILACLEGLSMRMAYSEPGASVSLPDPEVVLRLLGPARSEGGGAA